MKRIISPKCCSKACYVLLLLVIPGFAMAELEKGDNIKWLSCDSFYLWGTPSKSNIDIAAVKMKAEDFLSFVCPSKVPMTIVLGTHPSSPPRIPGNIVVVQVYDSDKSRFVDKKMLKVEVAETALLCDDDAVRHPSDPNFIKVSDGTFFFSIPSEIKNGDHLSGELKIVFYKAIPDHLVLRIGYLKRSGGGIPFKYAGIYLWLLAILFILVSVFIRNKANLSKHMRRVFLGLGILLAVMGFLCIAASNIVVAIIAGAIALTADTIALLERVLPELRVEKI